MLSVTGRHINFIDNGVVYLWLIAPRLLPRRETPLGDMSPRIFTGRLHIEDDSFANGKKISEIIEAAGGSIKIVDIQRGPNMTMTALPDMALQAGDRIGVRDTPQKLKELEEILGGRLYNGDTLVDEETGRGSVAIITAHRTRRTPMPKLTDTQLVILSAAAKRDTGAVLPLPKSLKAKKPAAANTIRSLIKRGLIAERRANGKDSIWRDEGDARLTLVITDTGLAAIGVGPAEAPAGSGATLKRKRNKQSMLIDLLQRPDGASLDELIQALGWQAHSVRGAIAGAIKKKLGFMVVSEKHSERGRVYRIDTANIVVGR